jgi:hypothetical protein
LIMPDKTNLRDIERTMREERWMLSEELFASERPEPDEVAAFRVLQETDWMHFIDTITDNPALRFFNPERQEFSPAPDWAALAADYGVEPFGPEWAISDDLPLNVRAFCRELRHAVRRISQSDHTGGCKSFYTPREAHTFCQVGPSALLVVCHDGGVLAPYFNYAYEDMKCYNEADRLLRSRRLWRESHNPAVTVIYPDDL